MANHQTPLTLAPSDTDSFLMWSRIDLRSPHISYIFGDFDANSTLDHVRVSNLVTTLKTTSIHRWAADNAIIVAYPQSALIIDPVTSIPTNPLRDLTELTQSFDATLKHIRPLNGQHRWYAMNALLDEAAAWLEQAVNKREEILRSIQFAQAKCESCRSPTQKTKLAATLEARRTALRDFEDKRDWYQTIFADGGHWLVKVYDESLLLPFT